MPIFRRHITENDQKKLSYEEQQFWCGRTLINDHPLFRLLKGDIFNKTKGIMTGGICTVDGKGSIYADASLRMTPEQWAYCFAHALLHLAFGHFDDENIPKDEQGYVDTALWNKACDIYIARFLADIRFGEAICDDPALEYKIRLNSEVKIYEHLKYIHDPGENNPYSTNRPDAPDMIGLEHPIIYRSGEKNRFAVAFSHAMTHAVNKAVSISSGDHEYKKETPIQKASEWFLTNYPLLGGLAASFKVIEDPILCQKYEIHIAAVDASAGEIICNPAYGLSSGKWRFVLAHEYLHAGLMHHKRCLGRDRYLWNIACDYCVNGWLVDMQIGAMPSDSLYDKELKDLSAEAIYDRIIQEIRKYKKLNTFRGFGQGDIMAVPHPRFGGLKDGTSSGISLDEFFKNALREGLDFHASNGRGYLPAGLVEEIRALTSPPIPWEVELGHWFDHLFPPLEKHRSYARPSRRQSATPDIPRPRYILQEEDLDDRTFGVVVDTSGSVSIQQMGLSLGAIASYAASKDVRYIRIVFCDADAYDQGYMTPDEIAGRVRVTGFGGTILQPGIDLLERARDFPKDAPILIITDGYIEKRMRISREHAFLLPKGNKLPFPPKGNVFYFR